MVRKACEQEIDRYKRTRARISRFYNSKDISDKEIIELLAEEIEQYRNRIENLERINKEKEIITERNTFRCAEDDGTGKDYEVVKWYDDGVLIKEEIRPL